MTASSDTGRQQGGHGLGGGSANTRRFCPHQVERPRAGALINSCGQAQLSSPTVRRSGLGSPPARQDRGRASPLLGWKSWPPGSMSIRKAWLSPLNAEAEAEAAKTQVVGGVAPDAVPLLPTGTA